MVKSLSQKKKEALVISEKKGFFSEMRNYFNCCMAYAHIFPSRKPFEMKPCLKYGSPKMDVLVS